MLSARCGRPESHVHVPGPLPWFILHRRGSSSESDLTRHLVMQPCGPWTLLY